MPKTATHAIRQALAPHLGEDDWQQQNLFGKTRLPIPVLAAREHGHLAVREVRPHLPGDTWASYFKFAFVRNPFDRFVSTCFFLYRREPDYVRDPTAHMKQALGIERFRQRVLVVPQSSLLTDTDGALAPDYIGRFEDLQASFEKVCRRIGIPEVILEKKNISEHSVFTQYYDEELKEMVTEFYRDDLRNFTYRFEASPPAS